MADHVTLAHDNTKSGDWTPYERSKAAIGELSSAVLGQKGSRYSGDSAAPKKTSDEALEGIDRSILEARRLLASMDTPAQQGHTQTMTDITDYRHELKLRDDSLRKELDLRQESFRAEQAVRDKALDDKFSGFFSAQAERDKSWEKISEARFDRIEKDVASIKTEAKAVTAELHSMKVTMAKYFGGAIVIGAIASALLGAALKHLLP